MNWTFIYELLLGVGAIMLVASLFFQQWFVLLLILGLLLCSFSLFEIYNLRKERSQNQPISKIQQTIPSAFAKMSDIKYQESSNPQPIAHKIPLIVPQQDKQQKISFMKKFFSLLSKFLPRKEKPKEEINVAGIKGQKQKPIEKQKKEDIKVIKESSSKEQTDNKIAMLHKFILDSIRMGFNEDKIREAAIQAHWPKDLFNQTYLEITKKSKKKKLIYSSLFFLGSLLYMVILYVKGMFLLPYWLKLLQFASPIFYIGLSLAMLAIVIIVSIQIKKTLKRKKIVYQAEEEENVKEIKSTLASYAGRYETDLDKLYAILKDRKTIKVNEVASAFGISKQEAEEWGKIMKEQDLAEIYYPAVGDMEIRWKKSKNTQ